jgi:hypothetical protein
MDLTRRLLRCSCVVALVTAVSAHAQSTTGEAAPAAVAGEPSALDEAREAVVREIVARFAPELPPPDAARNQEGGARRLEAALRSASAEGLLLASRAQSLPELSAGLQPGLGGGAIALAPGQAVTNAFGSTSVDLVFTPITPCRIIDTRATAAGPIGPNDGRLFEVNLANFSAQGGAAAGCGMPTAYDVSAVAINVTSTGQTGVGNIQVAECGSGLPTSSLLNYQAGVNVANAAVVRSAITCLLGGDIYVRSNNSASHVVVDLLGYFARPEATALDNNVLYAQQNVLASQNFTLYSPGCPAGFRLTGGGGLSTTFGATPMSSSRPVLGETTTLVSGINSADRWCCQGVSGIAAAYYCFSVCARVPGR